MLNAVTIILGAIATVACIFGYIFALNPDHKYVSLWVYGAAACLYVVAACWGIQQSWMESDAAKPHPTATGGPVQSVIINNNNQTGGSNTGIQNN